jgi:DNA-directed RNA polymerase specialized sigma24 family protein
VAPDVNVTTYASLVARFESGTLPDALARSLLVFTDEAHHAMTPRRMRALRGAFPTRAIRTALTATPDYDAVRRLAAFFPDAIHEMELREALRRGLLAPARVWVAEVDADASGVEIVAGDYEAGTLSRLMSAAPFLRAVERFRYRTPAHAATPCLVACATRQQATDLWRFLQRHRPVGSLEPALLLGETPAAEREALLGAFAEGRIDTIVQVGVLIEGWDAPRCKLLIDLAPSRSRVRSTQKYFRVLTRDGGREARIVVLLPTGLVRPPVLPTDLLLEPGDEYVFGRRIESTAGGPGRPVDDAGPTPIRAVRLRARTVICAPLGLPTLDPAHPAAVRRLLLSHPAFDPARPPGRQTFEALYFSHPVFSGTGLALTRFLGVPRATGAWEAFLARLFPDRAGDWWLGEAPAPDALDHAALLAAASADAGSDAVAQGLRALGHRKAPPAPDDLLCAAADRARLHALVAKLKRRHREVVIGRFGLHCQGERSFDELGDALGVSYERVRQVVGQASRRLRAAWRQCVLDSTPPDLRDARDARVTTVFGPGGLPLEPGDRVLRAWRGADDDPDALRAALAVQPDHERSVLRLTTLLGPRDDETVVVLEAAIATAPARRRADFHLQLGDVHACRDDLPAAHAQWEAAIAARADCDVLVRQRLARHAGSAV